MINISIFSLLFICTIKASNSCTICIIKGDLTKENVYSQLSLKQLYNDEEQNVKKAYLKNNMLVLDSLCHKLFLLLRNKTSPYFLSKLYQFTFVTSQNNRQN